jgi:hypothetical protein
MDASKFTTAYFNQFGKGTLPDHLGIIITSVKENEIVAEFTVAQSSGAERFPACRQRGHAG